jgi:hypothetical protein
VEEDHGLFFASGIGDFIEPPFRDEYPEGDQRRALLDLVTPENTALVVPEKYFEPLSGNNTVGTDFIVLRYADILLLYAEALNGQGYQAGGEAFDALNAVRTRAGAPAYTAADLPEQTVFLDAVIQERKLELPLELHRWYDLLRTGKAVAAMEEVGLNIGPNDLLFPVPNSQVQIYNDPSGFPQNPGY